MGCDCSRGLEQGWRIRVGEWAGRVAEVGRRGLRSWEGA
jgi:hypothetical protein